MREIPKQTAGAGWAYYAFELLFLPGVLYALAEPLGFGDAAVNFAYYFLNFVCVLAIFRDFLTDSLAYAVENRSAVIRAVLLGALVCWAANGGAGWLLGRFAPEFSNANDAAVIAMVEESPILMGVGTILLVPLAEECLFRGLIFSQIRRENRTLAYCVSVAAFCAVHVAGFVGAYSPATLALCFVQYIPPGLILAWSYDHSKTIVAPVLIHTAINAIAFLYHS